MVISGEDVCCGVVFGTLVGVFVFSVMWSELLMTSTISYPLWSSVYECQRVACAFTSPVRTDCVMPVLYAVLYVRLSCFVMRGCAVVRRYIYVCNCDVLLVEGMSVVVNVMLSLRSVMSRPTDLFDLSVRTVVKVCTL